MDNLNDISADMPVIALTFDDGPNNSITPAVLDLLEKYGAVGSFFLVGEHISPDTADVVKRAHKMGCEIDCHSLTHSDMSNMSADEILHEMAETENRIFEIIGEKPHFFRPPYISYNNLMFDNIELPFICGLGVDDWNDEVSTEQRIDGVLGQAQDGAIILLHDFEGNFKTVKALETLIPQLQRRSFRLVTVSQLFAAKGVTPSTDSRIIYSSAY